MNAMNQNPVSAAIPQLRAEIEALPQDRGGKRKGIPEELKRRIAEVQTESGMQVAEFAAAVSISTSAMCTWSKRFGKRKGIRAGSAPQGVGFKKVPVVADAEVKAGVFTIEGPNGMKVSGLGADNIARLWRALC